MSVPDGPYQAGPDTVVSFRYSLYDGEGECVEQSDDAIETFLFGYGEAAPALERALAGCVVGQHSSVRLKAKEAFGARDPDAVIEVDRGEFPADIECGMEFEADHEAGQVVNLKVLEVHEHHLVLDTNHPLAGQDIRLDLDILAVRPATQREIDAAQARLASRAPTAQPSPLMPSGPLHPAERLLKRPVGASPSNVARSGPPGQPVVPPTASSPNKQVSPIDRLPRPRVSQEKS